jgi:Domain of unknown function (DUF4112)
VALSLGSPPPDVIRHRFSVEPGLSSTASFRILRQRSPGQLACGGVRHSQPPRQQNLELPTIRATYASDTGDTDVTEAERLKTLKRIGQLAKLMDTAWGIPFTRWRFGLDSVFGLVPGAGDAINLGISLYTLMLARKLGAPNELLLRMAANAGIDFGLGSVPVVGDIFDVFFKSNTRNLKMLNDYLTSVKR